MSTPYILEPPVVRWICHLCGGKDVTKEARVHTRMHTCPKTGLTTPMYDEKLKVKVEVTEREDYIGNEIVQLDKEGRPVMNIRTTSDDGEDLIVYAPTSTARVD